VPEKLVSIVGDIRRCPRHEVANVQRLFEDGASRTRTDDLLGAIQALSQLSYSPAADGLPSSVVHSLDARHSSGLSARRARTMDVEMSPAGASQCPGRVYAGGMSLGLRVNHAPRLVGRT
jgi:hypothetical protein